MPFVKRQRSYYKYGTEPNASIVGSFARIDEGIASGFSASNYLEVTNSFDVSDGKTWEMVYKVTTGSNVSTMQSICGHESTTTNSDPVAIGIASGKFSIIDLNTSSSSGFDSVLGSYNVITNTTYFIKMLFNGSEYILSYSLDGVDYIEDVKVTRSTSSWTSNLILGRQESSDSSMSPWLGSIDLSQSYININGSRWWSGDSYTKVGSWIDDGVVSGFTDSNHLKMPQLFNPSSNNWEMVFKFTYAAPNGTYWQALFANGGADVSSGVHLFLKEDNTLKLELTSNNSTWNIGVLTGGTLVVGNTYWAKAEFTGSAYNLYLSEDGSVYNLVASLESSTAINATAIQNIGSPNPYTGYYNRGSIDLNSSYIKINNKDWWHGTKAYQINVSGGDVWEKWEQPILTSNGVLGGNSFACQMLNNPVNPAYLAFDGNTSTNARINSGASSSSSFTFYNPEPLKISTIIINASGNSNNEYMSAGKLYGSNDNSSWTELLTFSGLSYGDYTLDVNSDKSYKYHKFMPTSLCSAGYWTLAELKITAQKLMATGTIEDADYHVDRNKLYQLAAVKRSYYKYQDWEQPVLTENGTMGGDSFAVSQSSVLSGDASGYAWFAFDGLGSTTRWHSANSIPAWISWYNPIPLKISNVNVTNRALDGSYPNAYQLQYSDNNSTWTTVVSGNGTSGDSVSWDIPVTHDTAHKYWRLYVTSALGSNSGYVAVGEIVITAQELVAGTSSDYDYYTDKLLSYAPIVRGKRSYYKQDLNQRDTGTYTFTLDKDYTAKMLFVGNGGGGCSSQKDSRWHYSSGGSGACFEGLVRLPADTYTLTIGTLGYGNNYNNTHYWSGGVQSTDSFLTNSAGEELIRVGAGGMGYTSVGGVGGAAGVLTLGTLDILETKKATDGVYTAGNTSAGSVSAYDGTYSGYGAGTGSQRGQGNVYGIAGIFDLVLETDISDYDWYEDVGTKIY